MRNASFGTGALYFAGLLVVLVALDAGCGKGSDAPPLSTTTGAASGGMGGESTTSSGGTGGTTSSGGNGGTGGMGGAAGGMGGAAGGMGGAGGMMGPPSTCFNGMMDAGETGQDCGGPCGLCVDAACMDNNECASQICEDMTCTQATCLDATQNGAETGVDCGPGCTGVCNDGEGCVINDHCQSFVCEMGVCQTPTCSDSTSNGDETGIDCGGMTCPKCALGQLCTLNGDCVGNSCELGQCTCPNKMVISPSPNMGAYCIDKTEVTYEEYTVFFNASVPTANQQAECSWNVNWTPGVGWPGNGKPRYPVTGVNWCQAYAYCDYVGKRLCGKFGGGANVFADYADHTQSQWMNACTANGTNAYPYGQAYVGSQCNDLSEGLGDTEEVQDTAGDPVQMGTCEGGSVNLWHMSGNAREWEDSCDAANGAADNCRLRGGSFLSGSGALTCAANDSMARNTVAPDIGFRCCVGG
jgi:Sulfatase-modifying factor enzyme 1